MLYNYYTSSTVSSAVNSKLTTFKTLEELVNSRLDIGIEVVAYNRVFNVSHDKICLYKHVYISILGLCESNYTENERKRIIMQKRKRKGKWIITCFK